MSEENTYFDEINSDNIPVANIMVAGITGTGKSTLINAIFNEKLAATGTGRPVTDEIKEYNNQNIPIRIWDTVGLEIDADKTKESIKEIRNTIAQKSESDNQFDRIHAIWYCINSGSNRYQGAELSFIKDLYSIGVPFIIVLTQCIGSDEEIEEFIENIKEINNSMGIKDIEIVPVLATEKRIKTYTIEAYGLDKLVDITTEKMPKFIKSGFVAAQKVSKIQKRTISEEIIYSYIMAAEEGFWDKVPFINVFTTDRKINKMFRKIGQIYNVFLSEGDIMMLLKQFSKIGILNIEDGFNGLINPLNNRYNKKIEVLFRQHNKAGSSIDGEKIDKKERVARLILFYGYAFVDSIEELWEKYVKDKSDELEYKVIILQKILKNRMKVYEQNRNRKGYYLLNNNKGGI